MKNINFILFTLLFGSVITVHAKNPEPNIYGTITLNNGETKTGTLRWDDEEAFLSDIFNGRKLATVDYEHLSDAEKDALLDRQPGPKANFGDFQITFKSFFGKEIEEPYFNVFFGSIKKIDIANDIFIATLHDGTKIISNGGSNDMTDDVFVKTLEGDVTEFDMDDITKITFSQAPENAKVFGDGIYGVVDSTIGRFEGRIMWDKDERMTDEELDGNDDSKEHEIKFADIKIIEKMEDADVSRVVLRDGEELQLTGTNDVNRGNRGIWVDSPEHGRVEIDWKQFNRLTIKEVEVNWLQFDDYKNLVKPLKGQVKLKNGSIINAESITFDLNQQSQAELLYADINGNNRQVPLYLINAMNKNDNETIELTLKNGMKVMALNNRSVTYENHGIVTSEGGSKNYYPWSEVSGINFN